MVYSALKSRKIAFRNELRYGKFFEIEFQGTPEIKTTFFQLLKLSPNDLQFISNPGR